MRREERKEMNSFDSLMVGGFRESELILIEEPDIINSQFYFFGISHDQTIEEIRLDKDS